jgi:hypothetical protein
MDYDLRMEEEADAAAIVAAITPTYTGPVYDDKGYIIDKASVLKLMMGKAVGDHPDPREFGSGTDSELEELLLTAPTIPRTVPSSEADSTPDSETSPDLNTSSDDKHTVGNPNRRRRGRRSRNKNRKRASTAAPVVAAASPSADQEAVWPVYVNPALGPFFSPEAAKRVVNGKYVMTPEEQEVFTARDRTRKSSVATIDQSDFATSMRLFTMDLKVVVVPELVLADTGADLGLCISEQVAKDLKLTWTPGTSPLAGVNGVSYQSRANEEVIIRMGGDGRAMDVETTPEGGCFEAKVTPHIMSPDMQHSIGHDCIFGQELLYRSLASFDMLRETMEISPAYHVRGCSAFRIAIPCKMTTPRVQSSLVAAFLPVNPDEQPFMFGYVVDHHPSVVAVTKEPTPPAKPAVKPKSTKAVRFADVAASAVETISRIIAKPFAKAKPTPPLLRRAKPQLNGTKTAAPLHHGFPQESSFPTKEQYRQKRNDTATRNAAHRVESQELLANSSLLVAPIPESHRLYKEALVNNTVRPTHLAYSVEDLKRTGRLKDDGELELGDNTPTAVYNALSAEAAQRRSSHADLERRLRKLEAELVELRRTSIPARSAPFNSLLPTVREIVPPVNQAPPKPVTAKSTPGASSSGASRAIPPLNPKAKAFPSPTPKGDKGKAKAKPAPPKEPLSIPRSLSNHNQPLSIGSSPADAHLAAHAEADAIRPADAPLRAHAEAAGTKTADAHLAAHAEADIAQPANAPLAAQAEAGWTKVAPKRQRKSRQLAPPAPSNHPMATRRSAAALASPQGGQAVASVAVPQGPHIPKDTAEWDRLRGKVHTRTKSPEPVVRKLDSPRIFFLSKEGPNSVIPKALVAVTVAMSALPCARAETILIPGSNSPLEDEGFFWAQVFAALVIWVAFTFSRYLAGRSEWVKRGIYSATIILSSVWMQQLLNIRAPVATLWQSMIAAGWAAPAFWTTVVAGALFTHLWLRKERLLFRKAHRL